MKKYQQTILGVIIASAILTVSYLFQKEVMAVVLTYAIAMWIIKGVK